MRWRDLVAASARSGHGLLALGRIVDAAVHAVLAIHVGLLHLI